MSMTIYCYNCKDIPNDYSSYKGINYCMVCLLKMFQVKIVELKEEFPFFNMKQELDIINAKKESKK